MLISSLAHACLYDGLVVNANYPGSLAITLATESALQNKAIPAIPKLSGQAALARSLRWLAQLRALLELQQYQGSVSVFLVEGELWSRISDQSGFSPNGIVDGSFRLQLTTHTQEPSEGETALLLSEAALSALVSEQITLKQAQELGVVRIKSAIARPGF